MTLSLRLLAGGSLLGVEMLAPQPASAQSHPFVPYCATGVQRTCFTFSVGFSYNATGGTDVVARLTTIDRRLTKTPSLYLRSWARLTRVDMTFPDTGVFTAGHPTGPPSLTLVNGARQVGSALSGTWEVGEINEPGVARGFTLVTVPDSGGAEIIGCDVPPTTRPPYIQTCQQGVPSGTPPASGAPRVDFRFSTTGKWDPSALRNVSLEFEDAYGLKFSCELSTTRRAPNDPFGCELESQDTDGDGWPDLVDNCPLVSNPTQADVDALGPKDNGGDACDFNLSLEAVAPTTPISLRAPQVTFTVLGTKTFDVRTMDLSKVQLLLITTNVAVAPAMRGTSYITSVFDTNYDGIPDRTITFPMAPFVAAGLVPSVGDILLRAGQLVNVGGRLLSAQAQTSTPVTVVP